MKYRPEDIFTPQGLLDEVEKNPNLDFLMNIFNISRAFGVSGFGDSWSVGKHTVATALIAFFWAKHNNYPAVKRNKLVTEALVHDLHEAVTGDILPMFKSKSVTLRLEEIQNHILHALNVKKDKELGVDLKIIDLIAFLYEIKQVSPSLLHSKKLELANVIAQKQLLVLYKYCKEKNIKKEKVQKFLEILGI